MSDIKLNLLPDFIDNMLSPVATEAGEALADIIRIARVPITSYLKKNEIKLEAALFKLKKELTEISEENIVPPKASVVGPAMEDLFKYHLEEDHIVDAFTKLIAASMDSTKCDIVHPHLFHAVKQMSPLDSSVFASIVKNQRIYSVQPYCAFYMSGMPFPSYQRYEIALLSSDNVMSCNVEQWVKAFDSIYYLTTLGLVTQDRDKEFDTTSKEFIQSKVCSDLEHLMNMVQRDTITSLSLTKKITLHSWNLTNWGVQLAYILRLTNMKLNLYNKITREE